MGLQGLLDSSYPYKALRLHCPQSYLKLAKQVKSVAHALDIGRLILVGIQISYIENTDASPYGCTTMPKKSVGHGRLWFLAVYKGRWGLGFYSRAAGFSLESGSRMEDLISSTGMRV